jgi:chorismate dehydratase
LKYQIGLVNYTNTIPYVWCFQQLQNGKGTIIINDICLEIVLAHPAALSKLFSEGLLDAALLPIAALHTIPHTVPITQYGIACQGKVDSVAMFSNNPINDVNHIILDPQSNTSNLLTQILCREYWQQSIHFMHSFEGYQNAIGNHTAAVIIGDRAFAQKGKTSFEYDLGFYWQELTQLPFVFAQWCTHIDKQAVLAPLLQTIFEKYFDIEKSLSLITHNHFDTRTYLTKTIKYTINADMKKAIQLFLQKLNDLPNLFY